MKEARFHFKSKSGHDVETLIFAENDERKNCCTRIYHHGPADRHRGLGKKFSCRRNTNRICDIFGT